MKISDLIQKNSVAISLKSHTKEEVLSEIVGYLYENRKIKHKKQTLDNLLKRETQETTGIGDGIAIPHARIDELKKAVLFVGI